MTVLSAEKKERGSIIAMMEAYGSINIRNGDDTDAATMCDEETALIGERAVSGGYRSLKTKTTMKKKYTTLFLVLAFAAATVAFLSSSSGGPAPMAGMAAVGDEGGAPPAAGPFNWAEWGAKMKSYWAEKKE